MMSKDKEELSKFEDKGTDRKYYLFIHPEDTATDFLKVVYEDKDIQKISKVLRSREELLDAESVK